MPSHVSSPKDRTIVIAARHAERKDYACLALGLNWVKTAETPWDPPITELGWKQGLAMGECIKSCISELNLPPIHQVYSSPFQRCKETAIAANSTFSRVPPVRVEYGLSESLSEAWYRSWSLPTSNGIWNYKEREDHTGLDIPVNLDTLHRAALHPAASLLILSSNQKHLEGIDYDHISMTKIKKVYCWGSFESQRDQKNRMFSNLSTLVHRGRTVLWVSHGGPISHLYYNLRGDIQEECKVPDYASFSIYEFLQDKNSWVPLLVNVNHHLNDIDA
jgi:broad specificity phosphatase PhoE